MTASPDPYSGSLTRDSAVDRDVRALLRVNRELERDAAEARDRIWLLEELVNAFAAMASALDSGDIARCLLRAVRAPIGFERAMWLEVEETKVVVMRWLIDGTDAPEHAEEVIEYEAAGQLASVLRSRVATFGGPHELGSPVVDVRSWYALVPVCIQGEVHAVVFADAHRMPSSVSWYVDLVRSLAAVAAIAIEKATILRHMEMLASRDPLTGLLNRRAFNERVIERLATPERVFVFAIIDIDDFKAVNDARGHAAGDTVLKRLARTLLASSRADDIVGRFAGDEFVMLLDGIADEADAVLERLSGSIRLAGVSCSIGASRFPQGGVDLQSLFAIADRALYVAKTRGKNGFSIAPAQLL